MVIDERYSQAALRTYNCEDEEEEKVIDFNRSTMTSTTLDIN